jgi:periplasmic protein TonB
MFFANLLSHRSNIGVWALRLSVFSGGLAWRIAKFFALHSEVVVCVVVACVLVGCSSPKIADLPKPEVPTPAPTPPAPKKIPPSIVSQAQTPRDYRQDAAKHIYGFNQHRIYKGKLPPLLYAIGVVTFEVDEDGKIQSFDWMRKPKQAPEVIQEIERAIKAAEPFPAPIHLGRVRYTETWLWHKSGKFQLDTLTEGQL